MDYRHLFGTAAIILSGAVFVHTLNKANAFPQGPTILVVIRYFRLVVPYPIVQLSSLQRPLIKSWSQQI